MKLSRMFLFLSLCCTSYAFAEETAEAPPVEEAAPAVEETAEVVTEAVEEKVEEVVTETPASS